MRSLLLVALLALPTWSQSADWQSGIVQVSAKDKSPGTGFVVAVRGSRAYIVTCSHVVGSDQKPTVIFRADPEQPYPAAVRHVQGQRDDGLALIVADQPPPGVKAVQAQADGAVVAGTPAVVAGYPVSVGAFTVLTATIASIRGTELFITPQADEGFSGGPVLVDGRIAGVVYGHEAGFGRAVPAAIVDVYLRGLEIRWGSEGPKPPGPKVEPAGPSITSAGTVDVNPKDGLKYVWIPEGKFMMGCSPGDLKCFSVEKPPQEATVARGFWMGQTEVTQAAYERLMGTNPSHFKGAQRPVEEVTWQEATEYCGKVGLRLPTDTEWEYSARSGNPNATYGELDSIAWHKANSNEETHEVAQKLPNRWGLYDMLGNVFEWTSGLPPNTASRIVRGGSWGTNPQGVRVSLRTAFAPTYRANFIGFRCAGELP